MSTEKPSPEQADPTSERGDRVRLTDLLRWLVSDPTGHPLGAVVVSETGSGHPLVIGLIVDLEGRELFAPLDRVVSLTDDVLTVRGSEAPLRPYGRKSSETLLATDVVEHCLLDVRDGRLAQVQDVELSLRRGRWQVSGVSVYQHGWLRRLAHWPSRRSLYRDWAMLKPLVVRPDLRRLARRQSPTRSAPHG